MPSSSKFVLFTSVILFYISAVLHLKQIIFLILQTSAVFCSLLIYYAEVIHRSPSPSFFLHTFSSSAVNSSVSLHSLIFVCLTIYLAMVENDKECYFLGKRDVEVAISPVFHLMISCRVVKNLVKSEL